MEATTLALSRALEIHDLPTKVHCDVVGALARGMALQLGIDEQTAERIGMVGRIHDIGKLGIPEQILHKPAVLSRAEWTVMQGHAAHGAHILRGAGLYEEARWVLHHHEHLDGSGYPYRLRGDEIPLQSRIVLVAEAFDAMTSLRPYAPRRTPTDALKILTERAGTQFDPYCVTALYDVYEAITALPEGGL
jgi:HD-GYP domain-containing protein (c-di-GMP phosphodiesterase class II)